MRRFGLVVGIGLLVAMGASAAEYRFAVPEADVTVTIGRDGTAEIHYAFLFECAQGAHPIDIVDVGMPNLGPHTAVSAAVNGNQLLTSSIRTSTYLKPEGCGYEVHLGGQTIQPGATGIVEFTGREERMVWQDTTNPDQASFRFTPTWFGAQYVTGTTKLAVRFRLPIPAEDYAEVEPEILWQASGQEFTAKGVAEGDDVASVAWERDVLLTGENMFGVSFPKAFVSEVRRDSVWMVLVRWFEGNPELQVLSGITVAVVFGMLFFTGTRGTGFVVFLVLAGALGAALFLSPAMHLLFYPVLLILMILVLSWRRFGKLRYFPAEVCREGGGVRRGLTPVEAAVLLEEPFEKVMAMVIFELARKGIVEIRKKEPLTIAVVGDKRTKNTWSLPGGSHAKLWRYEPRFIRTFLGQRDKSLEEMRLDDPFDCLILRVSHVMKGHDLERTRAYYRSIVSRAWLQVQREGDPELRFGHIDKHLGWLMLDDDWESEMKDSRYGYRYHPRWWHGGHASADYEPRVEPAGGGLAATAKGASGATVPDTSFGDVAASVSGRLKNACDRMVSKLDSVTSFGRGGIDLSRVDEATRDALESAASGGGGGGGSGGFGGGCACACAGCACACACAGGGR